MTERHSLESWKKAVGPQEYEVERGGPTMLLRRVGLMDLIQQGEIPDLLSGEATRLASAGIAGRSWSIEELKEFSAIVDVVVMACSVSPPLTLDGSDDSLAISEIPFVWRVKVFNWAGESVGPLRRFRQEQNGSTPVVEFLQKLQHSPQPTGGD